MALLNGLAAIWGQFLGERLQTISGKELGAVIKSSGNRCDDKVTAISGLDQDGRGQSQPIRLGGAN